MLEVGAQEAEREIANGKLVLAARICQRMKVDITELAGSRELTRSLFDSGKYQDILGAYALVGNFGPYSELDLLQGLFFKGNAHAFLQYYSLFRHPELRESMLQALTIRLEKGKFVKVAKTCRRLDLHPFEVPGFRRTFEKLKEQRQCQVILGAYYEAGVFGNDTVEDLLQCVFDASMMSAFLVNAYRFEKYRGFESQIKDAIEWHEDRGLKDAIAWRRKFASLEPLPTGPSPAVLAVSEPSVTRLKPLAFRSDKSDSEASVGSTHPYILSQISKSKLERANALHSNTLQLLESWLHERAYELSCNNLIDLMAQYGAWQGIFEIKSINAENERNQVRHAISQLFEYQFLHEVPEATLHLVFSSEPVSGWLIDYLATLKINVWWIEDGIVSGPGAKECETLKRQQNAIPGSQDP